jgi:NAD(P)-dependent dehydrogenase (short-subunit alcohol dehydrogenase family)
LMTAPALRRSDAGAVINVASPTGVLGYPSLAAYSASKGGLLALTRAAAMDLAPDVRVNAVIPGTVATGMLDAYLREVEDARAIEAALVAQHPLARLGTPVDVAHVIRFLAGDEAAWITGASFPVDGGLSIAKGNPT